MAIENADLNFARETLRAFMDAVALTRATQAVKPKAYALRIAGNTAFDTAVISWCILFGSHDAEHQPLHWKNLFGEEPFRTGLHERVGLSKAEFTAYWEKFVGYRNEQAAHRDLDPDHAVYPNFDPALRAADFYEEKLREKVAAVTGKWTDGGTYLEQYADREEVITRQIAAAAKAIDG